jgi:hypothetical protein
VAGTVGLTIDDNPYQSPKSRGRRDRRLAVSPYGAAKFIVRFAWLVAMGGCVFASFHAGDRDPPQWGSAMFTAMAFSIVVRLTLGIALVQLALWIYKAVARSGRELDPAKFTAPNKADISRS